MGQLVFQATLGGQVNLVGPNTASTFNINVPAVAGSMVTTGDTGTVTNTMLAGSIANAKLTNSSVTVGSTAISLGGTATTIAGLTSLATNTLTSAAATALTIQSAGTTAITVDTSQNVGIGTSSPSTYGKFVTSTTTDKDGINIIFPVGPTGSNGPALNFWNNNNSALYKGATIQGICTNGGSGGYSALTFNVTSAGTLAEAARIDSSGNLLVGITTAGSNGLSGFSFNSPTGSSNVWIGHTTGTASGTAYVGFNYNGTGIGSITQSGTSGVLYNITSDRRLKTDIVDFTDSGTYIDSFKPRSFKWITDNSSDIGFITDEYQQTLPSAITGQPDAVDEEGKPVYQQGDFSTSAKMAIVVAELQSLRKRMAALEAK